MCLIEHAFVQEYVTPVEVIVCIGFIVLDCLIVVSLGLFHLTLMVIG